jgi:hypothetical protein
MMKIYQPGIDLDPELQTKYCRLLISSDEERRVLGPEFFVGKALALQQWRSPKTTRAHTTPGNMERPLGDRAGIDFKTDPMALNRRAVDVLSAQLSKAGQFLPLTFDEGEYSLFNITNVIDALDMEKSDIAYFKDGGFKRVLRYAFKPEVVKDEWIFKIPQQLKGYAFVTDRFVDLVNTAGLTGFGFELLWSNDLPVASETAVSR